MIDCNTPQGSDFVQVTERAFAIAYEIRRDPFAIRRKLLATPEILTPRFKAAEIKRDRLNDPAIIGYGQVGKDCAIYET